MCIYKRLLYTRCMHSYWRDLVAECQLQKEFSAGGQGVGRKCPIRTPPSTIGCFKRDDKCPACRQGELRIAELQGRVDECGRQIRHDIARDGLRTERLRGVGAGLDDLKSQLQAQAAEMAVIYADLRDVIDGAVVHSCNDDDDDMLGAPSPATMSSSGGEQPRLQ